MSLAPRTSAMTFAASVLPTPASPSMKRGFSSFNAKKMDVARPRSPMYRRSRRRCSTSSMLAGAVIPSNSTGRLRRLFYRPPGEDPRQVLLVLRARPQVARGAEPVGSMLRGLLRLGSLAQSVLDTLRTNRGRAHVSQPDAPVAVHLLRGRADDGPVEKAPAELDVLVGTVRDREHDLGHDLVRCQRRREQVLEEVLRRDRPLVGHDLGVEHQGDRRVVARRIGMRDHTAHRAHVAHLVVADLSRDFREDGLLVFDDLGVVDVDVTGERAYVQLRALHLNMVEALNAVD